MLHLSTHVHNGNMSANLYQLCGSCEENRLSTKFYYFYDGVQIPLTHNVSKKPICGVCELKVGSLSRRGKARTKGSKALENRVDEAKEGGTVAILLFLQLLRQCLKPPVKTENETPWVGDTLFQSDFDSLCEAVKANYYREHPLQRGMEPAIEGPEEAVLSRAAVSSCILRLTPDLDSFADLDRPTDMESYSINHLFRALHDRMGNGRPSNDIG
jgi:hypothetical protein